MIIFFLYVTYFIFYMITLTILFCLFFSVLCIVFLFICHLYIVLLCLFFSSYDYFFSVCPALRFLMLILFNFPCLFLLFAFVYLFLLFVSLFLLICHLYLILLCIFSTTHAYLFSVCSALYYLLYIYIPYVSFTSVCLYTNKQYFILTVLTFKNTYYLHMQSPYLYMYL